ncbi:MAG: DNA polymerase III subunit beta [Clostridiales bacterium]|nr:DNA polymerase III subunit beta [Clostridiales bacterium]
MKVILDGLDLADAVLKVSKALSLKVNNQILEGIKLTAKGDSLILFATDTELTIERKIDANVLEEGETVVTGRYFVDFIKKLEKEHIELSHFDGEELKIKYLDSETAMQVFSVNDYPNVNREIYENYFDISVNDFKEVIDKTVFACATDDTRPILKGCLFQIEDNVLTSVGLDGYRMAICKKEVSSNGNFKAIIPSRTLLEITRLLEKEENLKIIIQKNYLMVETVNTTLISRLIEGEFVKYNQIIPVKFLSKVTVNREMLLNSIERASVIVKTDRINIVKLDIKENYINVTSKSEIGMVNENVPITLENKDILIAFNSKYLLEYLKIINDEFINIYLNSSIESAVIKGTTNENDLYLLLPVRING